MREKLQTLSLVQLKEIAKEQGFKGVSNLNKANIIELLVEFSENRSKEVSNSEGGSPDMTGKDNSYQRDGYAGQNYSGQSNYTGQSRSTYNSAQRSTSKLGLVSKVSGGKEFTVFIYKSAANFSVAVFIFFIPDTTSPVFILNFLICAGETYTSLSPGKKFSHLINPKPSGITSSIPSAISPESRSLMSVG